MKSVLEGLQTEKSGIFENVDGFVRSPKPVINGQLLPLLVPEYKEEKTDTATKAKFAMSSDTLNRLRNYLAKTSDSVLAVRDNLVAREIAELRACAEGKENIRLDPGKNYSSLTFLQNRLLSHLSKTGRIAEGLRELDEDEDIVHFRKIRVRMSQGDLIDLQKKLKAVAQGDVPEDEKKKRARQFAKNKISEEEFMEYISGKSEETFNGLKIKNISRHYYAPVIAAQTGAADFIKHIIREESEVRFLDNLEQWLGANDPGWDAWMFSKIDETLDNIYIPYYDATTNEYTRFLPDFIFWMYKDDEYRIVFVDPKGTAHKSAYLKIDGYQKLFEPENKLKEFKYRKHDPGTSAVSEEDNPVSGTRINVRLLMFNADSAVPDAYKRFWTADPADIFSCIANG